jgi:hypothetical protein
MRGRMGESNSNTLGIETLTDVVKDKNVAEWDTLPKEEQDKRLASKPTPPGGAKPH